MAERECCDRDQASWPHVSGKDSMEFGLRGLGGFYSGEGKIDMWEHPVRGSRAGTFVSTGTKKKGRELRMDN